MKKIRRPYDVSKISQNKKNKTSKRCLLDVSKIKNRMSISRLIDVINRDIRHLLDVIMLSGMSSSFIFLLYDL